MEETPSLKKKVELEIEVDASTKEQKENRYQWVIDLAVAVDAWRIFPRLFLTTYIFLANGNSLLLWNIHFLITLPF